MPIARSYRPGKRDNQRQVLEGVVVILASRMRKRNRVLPIITVTGAALVGLLGVLFGAGAIIGH